MANKNLLTRISLKIDTWANWNNTSVAGQGANLVLKRGEVAFVQIGKDVPPIEGTDATSLITNPNTVMFKVGDGTTAFKDLKWASALAADVYDWAKKPQAEFETYIKGVIEDAITAGGVDLSNYVKTSDFDAFKVDNTSAIATAKSGAESTAKSYTDGQVSALKTGVIKTAQDTADAAVTAAEVADGKAVEAKTAADAAQTSADEAKAAVTKEVSDRATAITNAKTELKGSTSDTKDSATIAGAKKYADAAVSTAKTELTGTINGVSGVANQNKTDIAALTTTVTNNATTAANATKEVADDLTQEIADRKAADANLLGTSGTAGNTIYGAKKDAADAMSKANEAVDAAAQNAEDIAAEETARANAISGLRTELVGTASDDASDDTIKGAKKYADAAVAALVDGAPESLDTLNELAAALKDNAGIVDTLNDAIALKADKTTVNALDTRVVALEAIDHDHSNKGVLDGITTTKVNNWDSAATNSHTHSNKTVIDGITAAQVTKWDGYNSGKADKTTVDALTTRVATIEGDYLQADDYFWIDCGTSTTNIQ